MSSQIKKILYINLTKRSTEVKTHSDLGKYIGGIGLGLKLHTLLEEAGALIFSAGPLSGYFPFASKTSVSFRNSDKKISDYYLGGSLSSRIKFSGLDAIVITGKSKENTILDITDGIVSFRDTGDIDDFGLPGKKSKIALLDEDKLLLDGYFEAKSLSVSAQLVGRNISGIVITGTQKFEILNPHRYEELYHRILGRVEEMSVEKSSKPSCVGCSLGCDLSKVGEEGTKQGGELLLHSLGACIFAKDIYTDVNTIFSCLDAIDYGITHEDVENFETFIYDLRKELA